MRFGIGTALVLMLTSGAFIGLQFYVKCGGECGIGDFGFPAAAIRVADSAEENPSNGNSVSYSVKPGGLALNILALAAVLIFVGRLSEKILARFKPVAIPTIEAPRAQTRQRILFRRA